MKLSCFEGQTWTECPVFSDLLSPLRDRHLLLENNVPKMKMKKEKKKDWSSPAHVTPTPFCPLSSTTSGAGVGVGAKKT